MPAGARGEGRRGAVTCGLCVDPLFIDGPVILSSREISRDLSSKTKRVFHCISCTIVHHRRHPRRHNPDGLGAPTPGDAADGVVAPAGISSALEALAALHQKGALTDGEFAAAKAKLLG